MVYGDRIKMKRKFLGMTQQDLADRVGMSMMSIRRYEANERNMTSKTLKKIAEALQTTPDYLLGNTSSREDVRQVFEQMAKTQTGEKKLLQNKNSNEYGAFIRYLRCLGYAIEFSEDGNKCCFSKNNIEAHCTIDELDRLIRSSRAVVSGLLDDFINQK